MQGIDGEALTRLMNIAIAGAMKTAMADLHARLLAHENAFVAIIAALDRTGVLPIGAARSAIDAMAAGVAEGELNAPQKEVLRRISAALERLKPPPSSQRH